MQTIQSARDIPMRLFVVVILLLPAAVLGAVDKPKSPLAEARLRWLKGNYAEARDLYQQQLKDEKLRAAAAIGIARTHVSEGNAIKALDVLDEALKKADDDPDLLAAKA